MWIIEMLVVLYDELLKTWNSLPLQLAAGNINMIPNMKMVILPSFQSSPAQVKWGINTDE